MENKKEHVSLDCGCCGCVISLISLIAFCAIFSLFLGKGEFYNDCIKKVEAVVHCDTIPITK